MSACTIKHLDDKLHALDKHIAVLETVQHKDVEAQEAARKLQAAEYERRLEILNHEAEQLKTMQVKYLPREVWEDTLKELRKELGGLTAFKENATGRNSIISGVVAAAISLAFLILSYMFD